MIGESEAQEGIPADFSITFNWVAASVPPPYHSEYQIHLQADGSGDIVYLPDYAQHDPPQWKSIFACPVDEVENLYQTMVQQGVLRSNWRKPARRSIGDAQTWCRVVCGGDVFSIPAELTQKDAVRVAVVYERIKALVPQPVWEDFSGRFEKYQQSHA